MLATCAPDRLTNDKRQCPRSSMGAAKGAPGGHARVGVGRVGVGRVGSTRMAKGRAEAVQIRHGHRPRSVCWRRSHAHRAHRQGRKAAEALRDALLVARLLVEPERSAGRRSVARTRIAAVPARTAAVPPPVRRVVGASSARPRYIDALALELFLNRLSAPVRRARRRLDTLSQGLVIAGGIVAGRVRPGQSAAGDQM